MQPVWRAGPQPRSCEFSVACRTSTAILCSQCGVPDLNRDHVSSVWRAGPQPRNGQKEECQKDCQKLCQKECQKICQKEWSMVNACTPQGEPILDTGGEKKNYIMYIVLDRLPSHLAEIVKRTKECNPMLVEFRLFQP